MSSCASSSRRYLTAYAKHTTATGELPDGARAVLVRKTGSRRDLPTAHRRRGRRHRRRGEALPRTSAASRLRREAGHQPAPARHRRRRRARRVPRQGRRHRRRRRAAGPEPAHGATSTSAQSRRSFLPEEQVAGEEYRHGSRLRVYVTSGREGHQGSRRSRFSAPTRAWSGKLLRARGARDRGGTRRDRLARPRGRAPHQDRGEGERPTINAKGACIGELGRACAP
jgi:N utilization substance protein A